MDAKEFDQTVRLLAFEFLDDASTRFGDVVPWIVLTKEFRFEGEIVPLLGASGIWKPKILPFMPISISTAPPHQNRPAPYADGLGSDGLLRYRYRGRDPNHRDNAGLRGTMETATPLIYFFGVAKGQYMPVWPVYVVGDNPGDLAFSIAVDERRLGGQVSSGVANAESEARRSYVTRLTIHRLHQATFRERVLRAYREQCAICRLRHAELLDAAHILPDGHPQGTPVVPNGLTLCKLHHAAYDRYVLGIRPDLVIEIRQDILEEADGPMLRHGLQDIAGSRIHVPASSSQHPKPEFLATRYQLFRKAG